MTKGIWKKIKVARYVRAALAKMRDGADLASDAIVEMADLQAYSRRKPFWREVAKGLAKAFRDGAERLDPTPQPIADRSRQFPHGRMPWLRAMPAIIICKNEVHRERIAEAFPISGALYTTFGAALHGYRTDKIIIFEPDIPMEMTPEQRIRRAEAHVDYINHSRCRLLPGNTRNFLLL